MKSLPLLILVLFVAVYGAPPDRSDNGRRGSSPANRPHRRGHLLRDLTDRGKNALEHSWRHGMDVERRRNRLKKLGRRHFKHHKHDPEKKRKFEEARSKIVRVAPHERIREEGDNLFEVNELSGVADYLFQGDINLSDDQLQHMEETAPPADSDDSDDDEPSTSSSTPSTSTVKTTATIKTTPSSRNPDEGREIDVGRVKRQASLLYPKWKDNTLYYWIDTSISARKKASIKAALTYLTENTCVYFVEEKTATNRVKVFNGQGCYSTVGMTGGEQTISLGDGCEVIGTVAHEFTHALGVWHTQMRSDRDDYIYVDLTYVDDSRTQNFVKYKPTDMKNYVPYEYGSMMHYSANSFTMDKDELSMIPFDHKYVYTMGNRQISFYDLKLINDFYGCSSRCSTLTSARCTNKGIPNPRACSKCICPAGYGGALCDQRPSGCGKTLTATATYQSETFTFGNLTAVDLRDVYTTCTYWITAPPGKTIKVKITEMLNSQCNYGCVYNGIEIKTYADQLISNPRYCCPEFNNIELTSNLNPTPVIGFNRYAYTKFTIQYKYV